MSRLVVYGALALVMTAAGALAVGYLRGAQAEHTRCEAGEARALRAVMERLNERQAEVEALRAAHARAQHDAEASYADMQREIDRQRAAVARLGRLRDPGARAAGGGALPSPAGCAAVSADAPAGAELSGAATAFLRRFAEQCDRAAAYATGAHRWAMSVHGQADE